MPTPTSPAPAPNEADRADDGPPLRSTLAALRQGPVDAVTVCRLSDLTRPAMAELAAAWPSLPEPTRIAVVRRMEELVEDRIELDFGRALRVALADGSPVVRQLAVAALWEDERGDLLDRLRTMLAHDPSQDVRAEAARGLGRFTERAAAGDLDEPVAADLRAGLASLAADEASPYGVRRRALESVGVFGRDGAVRELIRDAYESDDQGLQASALFAMGRSLDRRWLEIVLDELQSSEAELRVEAVRACGALADDDVVSDLAPLAGDPDAEVRHAAIASLGQIGGRAAVRLLRTLAADADEADADLIDEALEEAGTSVEPLRVGA